MMRIEAYSQIQQLYNTNHTKKVQKPAAAKTSDQLQISSFGKDIQAAKQALANVPDVREEVVAPIKTAIQNGSYEVSSEDFARKIIEKYNEMR